MKLTKTDKKVLKIFLIISLACYLIPSAIECNFNPIEWEGITRGLSMTVFVALNIAQLAGFYFSD